MSRKVFEYLTNFIVTFVEGDDNTKGYFIFDVEGIVPMHVTPHQMIALLNGLIEVQSVLKSDNIIETYVKELDYASTDTTSKFLYATKLGFKSEILLLEFKDQKQVHQFKFDPFDDDVFEFCTYAMRLLSKNIALHLTD